MTVNKHGDGLSVMKLTHKDYHIPPFQNEVEIQKIRAKREMYQTIAIACISLVLITLIVGGVLWLTSLR